MKKEKLKLDALKVQSFVTSMDEKAKQTIDGGILTYISGCGGCPTEWCPDTQECTAKKTECGGCPIILV